MQSRRVRLTISMIVGTPRPSSPTSHPTVPSSSISEEEFDRLPSLSLSRWMKKALRPPPGRIRGTRKQESAWAVLPEPPASPVWARTRKASDCGAEQNHLWPVRDQVPSALEVARVVFARTSEPPCFSVMAMPKIAEDFVAGSRSSGS